MEKERQTTHSLIEGLLEEDPQLKGFEREWGPLANFLTDYNHLKALHGLTQEEIAKRIHTTQSAISRLNRMKGKPSYTLLQKISEAVNGKLYITPYAEMTATLPYDLHERARIIADAFGMSVEELMIQAFRDMAISTPCPEMRKSVEGLISETGQYVASDPCSELQSSDAAMVNCTDTSQLSVEILPFELAG